MSIILCQGYPGFMIYTRLIFRATKTDSSGILIPHKEHHYDSSKGLTVMLHQLRAFRLFFFFFFFLGGG